MGRRLILVVIIVLIVAIVVSIYVILPFFFFNNPNTTGTQYLSQCNAPWPPYRQTGPNTSLTEGFITMTANASSVAKICVEYNSNTDNSVTTILNGTVYFANNMSIVLHRSSKSPWSPQVEL